MIDTHAHLYLKQFKSDLEQVISRFLDQGVQHIYLPNIDHTTIDDMLSLELKYSHCLSAMMGLHPCSVKKDFESELYQVEEWLNRRSFAAVGEIGIDLYWDKSTLKYQQEAFKIQVNLAQSYRRPIVIHCRESLTETMDLLEPLLTPASTGVFHCFTGTREEADRIIAMGFMLGIGGVITFKNAGLDVTLKEIPLDHVVLETDSPYLAPVPYRGKRNEPAYLKKVAKKISLIKEMDLDEVIRITSGNARNLFSIDP